RDQLLREGDLHRLRRDTRQRTARIAVQRGSAGAQGLPDLARKGTVAEVGRRVAAGQGEVREETRTRTRRPPLRPCRREARGGRGRARRARDVVRRQATLVKALS